MTNDKEEDHSQDHNCHKVNTCQSGIDRKCHHHCTDHTCRCSHHHTQHHLVRILHIGHICCQTCNQTCCTEMINICKRIGLDLIEHLISQILRKPGRSLCSVSSSCHSGKQATKCSHDHNSTNFVNMVNISGIDTLIDNRCHQKWNQCLKQYFQNHKKRCCDRCRFIFFYFF